MPSVMPQVQQQIQRGADQKAQAGTRWSSMDSEERSEGRQAGDQHPQEARLDSTTIQAPIRKEDQERETVLIRCLEATRWVVVSLVILLTAAAIGTAIDIAIRPIDLYVSVHCGRVDINVTSPNDISTNFTLHFYNPSGRAGLRYANLAFDLFANSTTSSPGQNITRFTSETPVWVGKEMVVNSIYNAAGINLPDQFAGLANGTTAIGNATLMIEGLLQTRVTGLKYTRGYYVRYYCSPLTTGRAEATVAKDMSCSVKYFGQPQPTPEIPTDDEGSC